MITECFGEEYDIVLQSVFLYAVLQALSCGIRYATRTLQLFVYVILLHSLSRNLQRTEYEVEDSFSGCCVSVCCYQSVPIGTR